MRYINLHFTLLTLLYDRPQTDGRAIAYSERECEFTFTKNSFVRLLTCKCAYCCCWCCCWRYWCL